MRPISAYLHQKRREWEKKQKKFKHITNHNVPVLFASSDGLYLRLVDESGKKWIFLLLFFFHKYEILLTIIKNYTIILYTSMACLYIFTWLYILVIIKLYLQNSVTYVIIDFYNLFTGTQIRKYNFQLSILEKKELKTFLKDPSKGNGLWNQNSSWKCAIFHFPWAHPAIDFWPRRTVSLISVPLWLFSWKMMGKI